MNVSDICQILINAITIGSIYALLALGLTLLYGIMDILFFANGAMYMLGAYAAFYLYVGLGLNYFLVIPISMAGIGLIGVGIEKGLIKPIRGQFNAIFFMAMGLHWFLESMGFIVFGVRPKAVPTIFPGEFQIMGAMISWERLVIILVAFAAVAGLNIFLKKTRWGLGMRAFAEDSITAELQGINSDSICSLGFLIGCGLASLAGLLIAPLFIVTPVMGSHAVLIAFLVIGLGGLGSITGALLGAMTIGLIESFGCSFLGGHISEGLTFIVVLIFLTIRPTGLMGLER